MFMLLARTTSSFAFLIQCRNLGNLPDILKLVELWFDTVTGGVTQPWSLGNLVFSFPFFFAWEIKIKTKKSILSFSIVMSFLSVQIQSIFFIQSRSSAYLSSFIFTGLKIFILIFIGLSFPGNLLFCPVFKIITSLAELRQ